MTIDNTKHRVAQGMAMAVLMGLMPAAEHAQMRRSYEAREKPEIDLELIRAKKNAAEAKRQRKLARNLERSAKP